MTIKLKNLHTLATKINLDERLTKICVENDIVFMALFGSFVRGDQNKKSDIDILIKFDPAKEKSLLDLIHVENELKKLFRRKVDLLTIGSISPYLRDEVLNSMRVLYEKG
jgi:predicted nucleotidyltransferase